jgi:penicillin-binding protein 1A
MTVRIAQMVGIKRIKRVAKRLGIYTNDDNVDENYSMVLGSYETTLLKLVNAYSMIANGGRRVSPWLIERIDDRNGTTIFRRDTRVCETCQVAVEGGSVAPTITDERERVIDPRVAYQITSLLQGAVQRGTGTAANILKRPIAGKTGTTNDSRDTWFIGFTPDIVVGTYVGYDVPRNMGEKETGGRVAIQGFIKFMQQAADSMPVKAFKPPPGIREIPIDRLSGQPLYAVAGDAKAIISEAFLTGGAIFKPMNELQEELQNKESVPPAEQPPAPIAHDAALPGESFTPPDAGALAPYQRPIDPQGFNPNNRDAAVGTGGLY